MWLDQFNTLSNFAHPCITKSKAELELLQTFSNNNNLETWRTKVIQWYQDIHKGRFYNGKLYKSYKEQFANVARLLHQIQRDDKENDESIEIGGLILRKEPLFIDIHNEANSDNDVFEYTQHDDLSQGMKNLIGIRQVVLNDSQHPMHSVVQEELRKMEEKWYRPLTTRDLDKLRFSLPWDPKTTNKRLSLIILTGRFGCGMMEQKTEKEWEEISRFFIDLGLNQSPLWRQTRTAPLGHGSVFLVKDASSR